MTARELALSVVRDVFPPAPGGVERSAQASFDYRARRTQLSDRDRAFAAELAYGAIKMRRTLDWYLDPFLGDRADGTPLSVTGGVIREVLRLAIYELAYTRADEHATVFEFVNLAKRYGHRGLANLVNAVLRRFLRERPAEPRREGFESEREYLATRYSLPTWLVRQWQEVRSGGATARIDGNLNKPLDAGRRGTARGTRSSLGTRRRWRVVAAIRKLGDGGRCAPPSARRGGARRVQRTWK